jgi:hypothetical protein
LIGFGAYCEPFVRREKSERTKYVCELLTLTRPVSLSSLCVEALPGARLVRVSIGPIQLLHHPDGLSLDQRLNWRFRWSQSPIPVSERSPIFLEVGGKWRGELRAAAFFVRARDLGSTWG